jgi:tripartite-type tricarboxylate transporter receptor subunit TctC
MKDLQPIAFIGSDSGALEARAATGFKTVADFVKAAKDKPGSIKNGNDQPGGSSYIVIAVIEKALGLRVTRVPYQGYAPTVAALLAGEVDTATVPVPDAIEHHKSGKIRILGITDDQRHFMAPDVPTFKEQGFDVNIGSWRAMIGPRGIPKERLAYLEEKFLAALKDPAFVKRANAAGFAITPKNAAETWKIWEDSDKALYPILAEAGLVKARKKN